MFILLSYRQNVSSSRRLHVLWNYQCVPQRLQRATSGSMETVSSGDNCQNIPLHCRPVFH